MPRIESDVTRGPERETAFDRPEPGELFELARKFVMPFGKFRGRTLEAVGQSDDGLRYLDWFLGLEDLRPSTRTAVNHFLNGPTVAPSINRALGQPPAATPRPAPTPRPEKPPRPPVAVPIGMRPMPDQLGPPWFPAGEPDPTKAEWRAWYGPGRTGGKAKLSGPLQTRKPRKGKRRPS